MQECKGSPFEPAIPSIIFLSENDEPWLFLRINPDVSPTEALPKIELAFNKVIPSAPFDYKLADDEYNTKFKDEEQIAELAGTFAILALLISCLGLFGLAAYVQSNEPKK